MSFPWRQVVFVLVILGASALSHGRLWRAGWLGGDVSRLASGAHAAGRDSLPIQPTERMGWLEEGAVRPIAGLALRAHARHNDDRGAFTLAHARSLRLAAWILVLGIAMGMALTLRRAVRPWVGGVQADAAAVATALFVSTHPLGTAAIARPAAFGDLAALALASFGAALFLRGRQEGLRRPLVFAALGAILAGFASSAAILVAPVFAGLELGSANRPRSLPGRLRTAATTFVFFGACALFEPLVASLVGVPARSGFALALPDWPAWNELGRFVPECIEKLGIVFLPVTGRDGDQALLWARYLASCALVLLALQPVLRSSRSAPRLWGWLALAWFAALAQAVGLSAGAHVEQADYSRAEVLFPATIFACAGLAVAATALSGARRVWIPLVIAAGFAWLGDGAARGFEAASKSVLELRQDLVRAQDEGGGKAQILVIDPPRRAGGLDLGTETLSMWLDPLLDPGMPAGDRRAKSPRILTHHALRVYARHAEFGALRRDGLVVLAPLGSVRARAPSRPSEDRPREATWFMATEGDAPPITWRDKGRSDLFDLDPARTQFARIVALPGTSTAEVPRLGWRATEPSNETFETSGAWLESDGGPTAIFDLAASIDWWSARTIRRVWTEGALVSVAVAELLGSLPFRGELTPRAEGEDWHFRLDAASEPVPVRGEIVYVLDLLDLVSLKDAEIRVARRASADGAIDLVAPDAAAWVRRAHETSAGPVSWSLEARIGGVCVTRTVGR